MDGHATPRPVGARQAGWLFAVSGCLGIAALLDPGVDRQGLAAIVPVGNFVAAAAAFGLPWQRWSTWAPLTLLVPAFALVVLAAAAGLVPPGSHGVFVVVVFVWVGLRFPPRTGLFLAPAAAATFAASAGVGPKIGADVGGAALITVVSVLVAETIARGTAATALARDRAETAARLLRVVADVGADLHRAEPDQLLSTVVGAAMELGFDGAYLAVVDDAAGHFTVTQGMGLASAFQGTTHPIDAGIPARVGEAAAAVVIDDYPSMPGAIPAITEAGVRAAVGVPLHNGAALAGVLIVASRQRLPVNDGHTEALSVLAMAAGEALAQATRREAEQRVADAHARAAHVDALTGVGNRRSAQRLLDALAPGDALVFIDLDGFKNVNDRHGHAAGDQVLRDLGAFLQAQIRTGDAVVRYGGEEFLVVLSGAHDAAADAAQRMLSAWAASASMTTFSAGVAVHQAGRSFEDTLAEADAALYAAKRSGRNTVATAPALPASTAPRVERIDLREPDAAALLPPLAEPRARHPGSA